MSHIVIIKNKMNYNHHYFKNQSQRTNNGYSVSNKRKNNNNNIYSSKRWAGNAEAVPAVPCNPAINNQGGWKGHSPSMSSLYDFKTTEIALNEILNNHNYQSIRTNLQQLSRDLKQNPIDTWNRIMAGTADAGTAVPCNPASTIAENTTAPIISIEEFNKHKQALNNQHLERRRGVVPPPISIQPVRVAIPIPFSLQPIQKPLDNNNDCQGGWKGHRHSLSIQCKTCGIRVLNIDKLSEHLDWHFTINSNKDKKIVNATNTPHKQWWNYKYLFKNNKDDDQGGWKGPSIVEKWNKLSTDDDPIKKHALDFLESDIYSTESNFCCICKETISCTKWNDDMDSWVKKNCILLNNSELCEYDQCIEDYKYCNSCNSILLSRKNNLILNYRKQWICYMCYGRSLIYKEDDTQLCNNTKMQELLKNIYPTNISQIIIDYSSVYEHTNVLCKLCFNQSKLQFATNAICSL